MSARLTYFLGFLAATALLSASIYFQIFDGFIPCPLCTLQRITFGLLGILFLIGLLLTKSRPRLILNLFTSLVSLVGVFLAGRQIWLQHFPPSEGTACGVSIQYMMQILPLNEVIQRIFSGSAECSQRGWEFLSFNMAEWSLVWFVVFFALMLYLLVKKPR
ncbi:MAG: disulfide bond formation protein B [Gammaproteobacteria bacterium]